MDTARGQTAYSILKNPAAKVHNTLHFTGDELPRLPADPLDVPAASRIA